MNISDLKQAAFQYLAEGNDTVNEMFAQYLEDRQISGHYCRKLCVLLKYNWQYRICRRDADEPLERFVMPEFQRTRQPKMEELLQCVGRHDIISFDIFDTLLFRAVEKPADVFRLLEAEWNIIGFANARMCAERLAREKHGEISVWDIYKRLEKWYGIEAAAGVRREIETEYKVCFANPYMQKVYKEAKRQGKYVIAVSDMYLSGEVLEKLLKICGYEGIDKVYVSCEYGVSKYHGQLYDFVREDFGQYGKIMHIGDNKIADVRNVRQKGWTGYQYYNVMVHGQKYRCRNMRSIAASFYKGIVNSRLHSGQPVSSGCYELGFAYGGVLALGYIQFLLDLKRKKNIDLFLFTARDGYILWKVFLEIYEEKGCAYIPFSRVAGYQITMERNWKAYLACMVSHYAGTGRTVEEVLSRCGMDYMLPYLQTCRIDRKVQFNLKIYRVLEKIFEKYLSEILPHYQKAAEAAGQYFEKVIRSHKNICVVDVGWQGTSISCLKYFLEEKCGFPVNVTGALMGMNGNGSAELSMANGMIQSYLFSGKHNENVYKKHMGKMSECHFHNLLMEILFTQDAPTFLTFDFSDDEIDKVMFVYGKKEGNGTVLQEIQQGIYDFVRQYDRFQRKFKDIMDIAGQEAYIPFTRLAEAKSYCLKLLGEYEINNNAGIWCEIRKLKEYIKK